MTDHSRLTKMRPLTITLALLLVAPLLHAAITGSVIDANGNPVAGATIRAFKVETRPNLMRRMVSGKIDIEPLASAKTSDAGDFRLDKLGQPTVDIVAEAAGRETIARFTADGEDLTLMMREAKPRRLKVTAGGKAVANAIVLYGRPLFTRTGSDGTFELPMLSPSPYLVVYHPDYAPFEASVERKDTEVKLDNGTKLTGSVAGADGKPAANVDIRVALWPLAKSGDDGSFTIAHAPSSWRELRAETKSDVATAPRGNAASYTLKLRHGTAVTGIVRDAKTHLPVGGMVIGDRREGVITDASGAFTIAPILPGRYPLTEMHPLYEPVNAGPLAALVVPPAGARESIAATPLPLVSGTVVDEEHKPVAGVAIGHGNRVFETPGTFTRRNGTFFLHVATGPFDHQIEVSKDGYADTLINVPPGEGKSGVNVTLTHGVPLAIRVVDESRNAVPGLQIQVSQTREGFGPGMHVLRCNGGECTTANDGTLTLRVAPAKYDIVVAGPEIVMKRIAGQSIDARSGPLTITVERGADIAGRVTYTDGKPLTSAVRVMTEHSSPTITSTDDSGVFVMHGVPKGKVSIRASDLSQGAPFSGPPKEVTAPATNVILTFPRGGHISGHVVDASTGGPITDFEVNATRSTGMPMMPMSTTPIHADDGSFTLSDVMPGRVEVVATAEDYVRGVVSGLDVAEGQAVDNVEVRLDRAGRLRGRVTSSDGQALSGVIVSVIDNTPRRMGQPADRGTTDADGNYELSSVPAGQRNVAFSKDGFVPATKSVETAAGKESQLDATLDRGRELSGRVIDESGQPVAGADIRIDNVPMRPTQSDTDGSFKLAGLRDGKASIFAHKNGYSDARQDVDPASQSNVTLTLGRGATINGRITGLSAADLASVYVGFYAQGSSNNTRPDSAGNFTLSGARDGTITVQASIYGTTTRMARKVIEVVNGTAPDVELAFTQGFTVRGRVNGHGRPLDNVRVTFSPMDSSLNPGNAGIESDGSYAVSGLNTGDYRVFVVGPSIGTVYNDKFSVSGDGVFDIDLHASSISGRVTDRDGKPLSDVRIMASAIKGSGSGTVAPQPVITDSDGHYLFDFVQDGTFHLVAQKDQYQPATQDVTVAGGAPPVNFQLDTGTASTVRVTDASGAPILANVTVIDQNHTLSTAQTGAGDGVAQLWLPSGHYQVMVGAQGYSHSQTTIDVPGPEVRVTLSHGGTVIALVKDPTKVQVALVPLGQPVGGAVGVRGNNRWDHVAPGMYEVREYIPGNKTPVQVKNVAVADDQTVTVTFD